MTGFWFSPAAAGIVSYPVRTGLMFCMKTEISYFVGTIESGESGTVDMTITPDKVGSDDIHIKVTYEDVLGKSKTLEEKTSFVVNEEKVEADTAEASPEAAQASMPVGPIAGLIGVIVAIIVIVNIIKKQRQKKYE